MPIIEASQVIWDFKLTESKAIHHREPSLQYFRSSNCAACRIWNYSRRLGPFFNCLGFSPELCTRLNLRQLGLGPVPNCTRLSCLSGWAWSYPLFQISLHWLKGSGINERFSQYNELDMNLCQTIIHNFGHLFFGYEKICHLHSSAPIISEVVDIGCSLPLILLHFTNKLFRDIQSQIAMPQIVIPMYAAMAISWRSTGLRFWVLHSPTIVSMTAKCVKSPCSAPVAEQSCIFDGFLSCHTCGIDSDGPPPSACWRYVLLHHDGAQIPIYLCSQFCLPASP